MDALEIKARLERALHSRITSAEWTYLEDIGLVSDYENGGCDWPEFRCGAEDNLGNIRTFRVNDRREQAGELRAAYDDGSLDNQVENPPVDPEDRTFARGLALSALDRLHTGGSAPPRARVHSTLLPRGGVDGTLPQWIYITAVELWMPAEEVMKAYRQMQQTMMTQPDPPRTQARALNVARFVWEQELHYGERPSWPVLCERWNNYPLTMPFKHWRDFRTYYLRGAKATPPRYVATEEQLTEQVKSHAREGAGVLYHWADKILAATVPQRDD